MITEDYVSFEVAKLLKEKGFNKDTYTMSMYDENGEAKDVLLLKVGEEPVLRPTLQMAMKWLREVHNILLVVDYDYEFTSTSYIYKIYRLVENGRPERVIVKGTSYDKDNNPTEHIVSVRDYERSAEEYATYQQAAEAAIKYCLENLI